MSVGVMTVGVMSVGEITVGVMTVGVMRRPRFFNGHPIPNVHGMSFDIMLTYLKMHLTLNTYENFII